MRRPDADVLLLKQILKRRPRIVGLQTRRCGRFLFTRHANLVQRAVIARILFRDPFFDRLHALEAAAGIEVRALLAGVQFESALRALPFPRACRTLQHRSALRAPRHRPCTRQVHRPRSQRVVPTWRTALALRRGLARLWATRFSIAPITVLISGLTVFCQNKPPRACCGYCPPDTTRAASVRNKGGKRIMATDQGRSSRIERNLSLVLIRGNP